MAHLESPAQPRCHVHVVSHVVVHGAALLRLAGGSTIKLLASQSLGWRWGRRHSRPSLRAWQGRPRGSFLQAIRLIRLLRVLRLPLLAVLLAKLLLRCTGAWRRLPAKLALTLILLDRRFARLRLFRGAAGLIFYPAQLQPGLAGLQRGGSGGSDAGCN